MKIRKYYKKLKDYFSFESFIWISGLLFLSLTNFEDTHISICPLKNLDFPFCPGCGLGESIHHLFRLQLAESLKSHPLGLFALGVLVCRVVYLIRYKYLIKNLINTRV